LCGATPITSGTRPEAARASRAFAAKRVSSLS
jgi:hypothetical protein